MLSRAGWWGVSIFVLASATIASTPSRAVGQTTYTTQDENIADAAYCPQYLLFELTSTWTGVSRRYYGYAKRGADSYLGKVFYSFNTFESGGYYQVTGTFWLLGWECRMGQWYSAIIDLTNSFRVEYIEWNSSSTGYASGGGCDSRDEQSTNYDPYGDSSESPVNGGPNCGGGGGGADGSDPGEPPPPPDDGGGSSCSKEYLVIEMSNDGGASWYVYWEGEAIVC